MIENHPVLFILSLFLGINILLSIHSGWAVLFHRSPALKDIEGKKHWFCSMNMNVVFSSCLKLTVGEKGIRFFLLLPPYVYPNLPFLIEWHEIKKIEQRSRKWRINTTIELLTGKRIHIFGLAADTVAQTYNNLRQNKTRDQIASSSAAHD